MDNDGDVDIILGNFNTNNQLLINDGLGTFNVSVLPGGTFNTRSIATADVDNDGDLDIIIGNGDGENGFGQSNQLLLNNGAGTFTNETLPGGALDTASIAVIPTAPRVSMFYS